MVTAGNGSVTLRGVSGRSYNINFYSSDVVGASCTFNLAGLAGANSQNFYILPENCVLVDISFASTNTVSTNFVIYVNDVPIGSVIPIANVLNTLAYRVVPQIPLGAGRKFTMIQA